MPIVCVPTWVDPVRWPHAYSLLVYLELIGEAYARLSCSLAEGGAP